MTAQENQSSSVKVSFATNGGDVKELELPKGSCVADVLEATDYKHMKGETVYLNGKPVKLGGLFGARGPAVKEGDKVTVTPNISGG